MQDFENLRHTFLPTKVATLFVGESPPTGGAFFYIGNSLLYRCVREAFGDPPDFLALFKAKCYFLDDLVLYPIDKMAEQEKRRHRRLGVSSLALRMIRYQPAAVVTLMCAIEQPVAQALSEAGLDHVPHHVTASPADITAIASVKRLLKLFRSCRPDQGWQGGLFNRRSKG